MHSFQSPMSPEPSSALIQEPPDARGRSRTNTPEELDAMTPPQSPSQAAKAGKKQPAARETVAKKEKEPRAVVAKKPGVPKETKPAVKRARKPRVKQESKDKALAATEPVLGETEAPAIVEEPAPSSQKKAGQKRKSIADVQEHGRSTVAKRQRKESVTSAMSSMDIANEDLQSPATQEVEHTEPVIPTPAPKKKRKPSKNAPIWVNVVINRHTDTEHSYMLPVEDLVERSKLFAEELQEPQSWKKLAIDPSIAKTRILYLESGINPKIFWAVIHGIVYSPRFSLRREYGTARLVTNSSDGEESTRLQRCVMQIEWTLENLMEAYLIADYLGCGSMCDSIMSDIILEHQSRHIMCEMDCAGQDLCEHSAFCQDPDKLRPVIQFVEYTNLGTRGRMYFIDFYSQHYDVLQDIYASGNAEEWCDKTFWKELDDASKNVDELELLARLGHCEDEGDFCSYHEHQSDESLPCPAEVAKEASVQTDFNAAYQPLLDHLGNVSLCYEAMALEAKKKRPWQKSDEQEWKQRLKELKSRRLELVVCQKIIERWNTEGSVVAPKDVPKPRFRFYPGLVDAILASLCKLRALREIDELKRLSIRENCQGKRLPKTGSQRNEVDR